MSDAAHKGSFRAACMRTLLIPLTLHRLINIASIENLTGVLCKGIEASPPEDSVILDEQDVIQGKSRAGREEGSAAKCCSCC